MGSFTWGRIAAVAGVGAAAAGITYLLRTERGQAILEQGREKARDAWLKARGAAENVTDALQEKAPGVLGSATELPEHEPAV